MSVFENKPEGEQPAEVNRPAGHTDLDFDLDIDAEMMALFGGRIPAPGKSGDVFTPVSQDGNDDSRVTWEELEEELHSSIKRHDVPVPAYGGELDDVVPGFDGPFKELAELCADGEVEGEPVPFTWDVSTYETLDDRLALLKSALEVAIIQLKDDFKNKGLMTAVFPVGQEALLDLQGYVEWEAEVCETYGVIIERELNGGTPLLDGYSVRIEVMVADEPVSLTRLSIEEELEIAFRKYEQVA